MEVSRFKLECSIMEVGKNSPDILLVFNLEVLNSVLSRWKEGLNIK